jgi:FemAB-related protein (PEP-CTERM system-associated)
MAETAVNPEHAAPPSACPIPGQTVLREWSARELPGQVERLAGYVAAVKPRPLSRHPAWLLALHEGLGHEPICLEAQRGGQTVGLLPLARVRSLLFGRFLVSLPYLNYGGVLAADEDVRAILIECAVAHAARMKAKHLELRHEDPVDHPALNGRRDDKVHMRLDLPATGDELWKSLDPKVRNQVRKGEKAGLEVVWAGAEGVPGFYEVFSANMRDLGTPVYGAALFRAIFRHFPEQAEVCVVRLGERPVAAALLLHGWGVTEVPSASSLRAFNHTCANMLMYWHLLQRAIGRRQAVFDFGRSTTGGSTFKFKKQWGARPCPAVWQYATQGEPAGLRPDNPKFQLAVRAWRKLPVWLTRLIGPPIVRGIP